MITWIVDKYMFKREYYKNFLDILKSNENVDVVETCYIPFSEYNDPISIENKDYVVYGTHGYIINARKHGYHSGIFCNEDALSVSNCLNHYKQYMLNSEGQSYILKDLIENDQLRKQIFQNNSVHIRPDKCDKSFTGFITSHKNWSKDYRELLDYDNIDKNQTVYVSPVCDIECEMRFIIIDKKVVTGSTYRYNNVLDIRTDVFDGGYKLAETISSLDYQPDIAYTVDIAKVGEQFKIIELNSFSCAGFYACDVQKIIDTMNEYLTKRDN